MAAVAVLSKVTVRAEPGGTAELEVSLRNDGIVVDEFRLEVLGVAAEWALVEPSTVSLFPGADGTAKVIFQPPRDHHLGAGAVPFAVKVVSHEDPDGSVVEEGTVEIGVFADNFAELVPRTVRGRRVARCDLAVDNRGNAVVNAALEPIEPDGLLAFDFSPPALAVAPGTAAFCRVRVLARDRFWRGPLRTYPFQVMVTANDGSPPLLADGTFVQEPILPTWLGKALALLLALALLAAALWFLVLRPEIRSQAEEAAKAETGAATEQAAAAQQAAEAAKANSETAAAAAQVAASEAAVPPGGAAPSVPPVAVGGPTTSGTGGRIQLNVPPGQTGGQSLSGLPADLAFQLTDIVLENPNADVGTVRIRRAGAVLFELALVNFRDLDYHFISPITFPRGQQVTFEAVCANATPTPCRPAVYLGGYVQ